MTYGRWLKHERARLGLTQRDIEARTGISSSHVSKIERDTIRKPDDETRSSIHRVLGTTDADLVEAGVMEAVEYRDGTTRYQWPGNSAPLIPPAQQPTPPASEDDAAFYRALGEYLPALGPAQRSHLIETARMMTTAAALRAPTRAASPPADHATTEPGHDPASRR